MRYLIPLDFRENAVLNIITMVAVIPSHIHASDSARRFLSEGDQATKQQ